MKKMKLSMLLAAVGSVFGFTSCLDSGETSNTYTYSHLAKVTNFMGLYTFTAPSGLTLVPLSQSGLDGINEYSDYTWLLYSVDGDTQDLTSSEWDITVLGSIVSMDGNVVYESSTESNANAPVRQVTYSEFSSYVQNMFFDLNNMFLPVYFYLRDGVDTGDESELEAELLAHEFTLYYNPDEDFESGTMTLHLRHYITDWAEDDELSTDAGRGNLEHYNISVPLNAYVGQYGSNPETIIIEYEQSSGGSYDNVTSAQFEIDYQSYVDYYNTYIAGSGSSITTTE